MTRAFLFLYHPVFELPQPKPHMRLNMLNQSRVGVVSTMTMVAFLVPVLASVYLSWRESYAREKSLTLGYAQNLERRMDEISGQLEEGADTLQADGLAPCSPQEVKLMRQIDLGSSYIKAAARIERSTLLCTSQGVTNPVSLGKPELATGLDVSEYSIPGRQTKTPHPLKVFAEGKFAAIVDPNLVLDIATESPDVELAVVDSSSGKSGRVAALGPAVSSDWLDMPAHTAQSTILNAGYLVSRVRLPQWHLLVIAATPQGYIDRRIGRFAVFLIPLGALCGGVLALTLWLMARIHSSFPTMLRRAIREESFYVLYQPVIELVTLRVIGAEVLVRWRTSYDEMRPDFFIPQAEQCGLIQLITERVLDLVAHDLPRFLRIDPRFRIAINLSASDLQDVRLLDAMDRFLEISGASPENVELEATERAFLESPSTAKTIGALRAKGFSVAIDDFGTGYSSLACLQTLPLDTLKIDRAFVDTIHAGGTTSHVVEHIIEMAHELDLEMVAEGVETEPQAQYLLEHGVRLAQGWQFGRPMELEPLCQRLQLQASAEAAMLFA